MLCSQGSRGVCLNLNIGTLTSLSVVVYPYTDKRARIDMANRSHPSNPLALAVLALLFERPMHPYEMGLIMKQRHKEDSIKLRYGSLYTVIDLLLGRGFISARGVARDGRRPERTVYEITAAGRSELRAWMADLIGEPVKEYPQFEAALCLLPVLPPDEALALLRQRLTRIEAKATQLERQSAHLGVQNFPPLFLIENEYRLALVKAEQRFIAELITRIEGGWGPLELWRGFHQNREATLARLYRDYGGGPMTS
jgi:DNA-binding PadR family transcriptional regulator